MSKANLKKFFDSADHDDQYEGSLAYLRYNELMRGFADLYGFPLPRVVAAFVSLSPNNDYYGNLRSLASCLDGLKRGLHSDEITISTYKHCRTRAISYLMGLHDFESNTTGPKILAFYNNIVNPWDTRWVTVDGHMVGAWLDMPITMKEGLLSKRRYDEIAEAVRELAIYYVMLPCQFQATVWFVRKRLLNIRYDAQLSLLHSQDDKWRTMHDPRDIKPYTPRRHVGPKHMGTRSFETRVPDLWERPGDDVGSG